MSIKVLDNLTINKIAAGEVIENATSVVKELVENSIDAKATDIRIEIEEAGLKTIKVIDNGIGIEAHDIKIAFAEHATSKLVEIDDLMSINSFGFRGEALPSIAAVSDVEITTKVKDGTDVYGYKYSVGKKSDLEKVATNAGTIVTVKNLFANVPVRKKFLKDNMRENSLIQDQVIKFALSNLNVSFKLIIDGKLRFVSNGDGNIKSVLYNLYGKEVYDNLVDVDYCDDFIRLVGVLAKPQVARNNRQDEIYFINKRYVKNKIVANAVEGAYAVYLMQHKFPLFAINIEIDGRYVHPKKMEVRFDNDEKVHLAIYKAVEDTLQKVNLIHEESIVNTYKEDLYIDDYKPIYEVRENHEGNGIDDLPTLSSILNFKADAGLSLEKFNDNLDKKVFDRHEEFEEKHFITKTLSEDHKYIGQVFKTYILVEYEEKLYIIDQHAAHEKINFEKLMKLYNEGKVSSQTIFPSIVLKLTPLQFSAVQKYIKEFEKIGYEIEIFGDREIKVDAVPYNIFNIGNEKLLMDMIDSFADDKMKEEYDSIVEKIASISCKKSIKANHILSEIEVKELLRELFKLDNPYNCPHGRPTIISLSKSEFEKKFGRIV